MHRFYLPPDQCRDTMLHLTGNEAHHAAHVLRARKGEMLTVLDGEGHQFTCEVQAVSKKEVSLRVVEKAFIDPLPYNLTLLQAVPKGKTMDLIIQKATELGVARIVPLLSERSTVHLESERIDDKRDKWQTVAIEAVKQCGQTWLPKVESPVTPRDFITRREQFDLPLVGSLLTDSRHPREHFKQFVSQHGRHPKTACIWVGPEGDFSPAEMDLLKTAGVLPITLGRLVLRCETAAIYCLSILNYELQSTASDNR
jgi:16S rRNA (uracil1498-N3)-methyltransferase